MKINLSNQNSHIIDPSREALSSSLTYFDDSSLKKNKIKDLNDYRKRYTKWRNTFL